jgi:hypothetical protein
VAPEVLVAPVVLVDLRMEVVLLDLQTLQFQLTHHSLLEM